MSKLLPLLAAASLVLSFSAHAAGTADAPAKKPPTAQQQKMTSCNAEAKTKNLAGDERKAFMKQCLSNKPQPAAQGSAQQARMKSCNADAKTKDLAGDARKAFMKECLSSKPAS